jgi:hypothetical protein
MFKYFILKLSVKKIVTSIPGFMAKSILTSANQGKDKSGGPGKTHQRRKEKTDRDGYFHI